MKDNMIKLTGLWKNETKDKKTYLSGNLTYGTKLLIFQNKFKETDKDPDYNAYIAVKEQKQGQPAGDTEDVPF